MFTVFRLSHRDTHGSFGELKKGVETLAHQLMFSQHFSLSHMSTRVYITQKKRVTCFLFLSQLRASYSMHLLLVSS